MHEFNKLEMNLQSLTSDEYDTELEMVVGNVTSELDVKYALGRTEGMTYEEYEMHYSLMDLDDDSKLELDYRQFDQSGEPEDDRRAL